MSDSRSSSGIAEGDIYPCRFVKVGAAEGGLLAATAATDKIIGISFKDTRRSDYVDTSGKLAASGEPLSYYRQGARCKVEAGGTITIGALLKATTAGLAIVVASSGDYYGARALGPAVTGEYCEVEVTLGQQAN
jgi:hypothetical protein